MTSTPSAHATQRAIILLYALLIGFLSLWTFYLHPPEPTGLRMMISVWIVRTLPLWAFLPAILKQSSKGLVYFCLVLLFYFMLAVVNAFNESTQLLGIIESILTMVLFLTVMMHINWRGKARKAEQAPPASAPKTLR